MHRSVVSSLLSFAVVVSLSTCAGSPTPSDGGVGGGVGGGAGGGAGAGPGAGGSGGGGGGAAGGGQGDTDAGTVSDAGVEDAGVGAPLYSPCTTNSDCAAPLTCELATPGGRCTRPCQSSQQCGSGVCHGGACWPRCTLGEEECRPLAEGCVRTGGADDEAICYPACHGSPSAPVCSAGRVCDAHSGACATQLSMGAPNGSACAVDDDCAGKWCVTKNTPGFPEGYCLSRGVQISSTDYNDAIGMPLPRSSCPMGAVVLPSRESAGDITICWASCDATTPCREGYECEVLTLPNGDPAFTNGACLPINCARSTAQNNGCPASSFCAFSADGGSGSCTTDAGP